MKNQRFALHIFYKILTLESSITHQNIRHTIRLYIGILTKNPIENILIWHSCITMQFMEHMCYIAHIFFYIPTRAGNSSHFGEIHEYSSRIGIWLIARKINLPFSRYKLTILKGNATKLAKITTIENL